MTESIPGLYPEARARRPSGGNIQEEVVSMKKTGIGVMVGCCLLIAGASYAAQPAKGNPNLVGTWALVNYSDGRIYEHPFSCLAITSQSGNLFEATFYWSSTNTAVAPGTVCYDPWDPVSCPAGTVTESIITNGYRQAAVSGSIYANQVMIHGQANISYTDPLTGSKYDYRLSRTAIGLYDQPSDSISGVTHISIVIDRDETLYGVSNETRGFRLYNRGTPCPGTQPTDPITWVGH